MAEKPKKKAPVNAPNASGPMCRSRIRSSPIVTLAALKKWLARLRGVSGFFLVAAYGRAYAGVECSSTSNPGPTSSAAPASRRAERRTSAHGLARKKSGAQEARRISPTSFRGWWPEPGGGAWPRTWCRPAIAAREASSAIGGELAETMIPPAAPGEGELVHMARSQKRRLAGARFCGGAEDA